MQDTKDSVFAIAVPDTEHTTRKTVFGEWLVS